MAARGFHESSFLLLLVSELGWRMIYWSTPIWKRIGKLKTEQAVDGLIYSQTVHSGKNGEDNKYIPDYIWV